MHSKEKNRYFIQTFGCQMNVNDSEKIAGLLESRGYRGGRVARRGRLRVPQHLRGAREGHDQVQAVARAARPDEDRAVPSCRSASAAVSPSSRASRSSPASPQIDVLVGTHNIRRIPELVERSAETGRTLVDLDRGADAFDVPDTVTAHVNPVRAYVTAMEGCNLVCSFCVVPRTRGPEVNRPADRIVAEVEAVVAQGFSEVMLLGQTVNAYRSDGRDFADLLALVDAGPGLEAAALHDLAPEPRDRAPWRARSATCARVCPYLHLPVQSGSDRVLGSMRRGYTRAEYLEKIAMLREHVPGLALSSDVIVGYPGETAAEFDATLSLVEDVGFDGLFSFSYSPRPGTTAIRLADDVPEAEKKRRLTVLNGHQQQWQRRRNESLVGSRDEVLVETIDGEGRVSGRTPHFRIVHFDGPEPLFSGRTVAVEITAAGSNSLQGRLSQLTH